MKVVVGYWTTRTSAKPQILALKTSVALLEYIFYATTDPLDGKYCQNAVRYIGSANVKDWT